MAVFKWGFAKGVVEGNDPTGSDAISKMVDGIYRAHIANGLCLTNNLPYIQVLEYGKYPNPPKKGTYLKEGQKKGQYTGPGFFKFSEGGYSKQAPKGMVRISIQEIQKDLSDILDDVIDNEHGSFTKGTKAPYMTKENIEKTLTAELYRLSERYSFDVAYVNKEYDPVIGNTIYCTMVSLILLLLI